MLERIIKEIDSRADIEWKYARSKLYIEYIRDGKYTIYLLNICASLCDTTLSFFHKKFSSQMIITNVSFI